MKRIFMVVLLLISLCTSMANANFTESLEARGINADGSGIDSLEFDILNSLPAWKAGQVSYDSDCKCVLSDTGFSGVRVNAGRELHSHVYNDTGVDIDDGDPVSFTLEVDATTGLPEVAPTSSASPLSSLAFAGVATMDIPAGQAGIVTSFGLVRDVDTSLLSNGFIYADDSGGYTQIRPTYPKERLLVGGVVKVGASDGIISVKPQIIKRRSASRSYTFTSAAAAAGTHYRAGFYDWATTDTTLTNASTSITHGVANLARAGHVGIVAAAAGTVDTGQVGIQVTGTLDSEEGPQTAAQTAVITDDITTLTTNQMVECIEKFSGTVTISTYIVSGTPTTWSVTFNYGYSKYEDFANIDGTVTAFNAVWEAGAADSSFNITLLHHKETGWTYAATGFEPGDGFIYDRLTDQGINSGLAIGVDGACKRTNLSTFIDGSEKEGIIIRIVTGSTNSIRSMDMHVSAFSEELN